MSKDNPNISLSAASNRLPAIPEVGTTREMRDALDQAAALRHMLESLHTMDSYFDRFIEFEVGILDQVDSFKSKYAKQDDYGNTYYRFTMDGASKTDKLRHCNLITWWASLPDSEREEVKKKALTTRQTISGVYRGWKSDSLSDKLNRQRINAIRKFNLNGQVDIKWAFDETREAISKRAYAIRGAKDDLRHTLRKHGAVGIGDGVYVKPGRNADHDLSALKIRYKNLTATTVACARLYDSAKKSAEFETLTDTQREFLAAVRNLFADGHFDTSEWVLLKSGTPLHVKDSFVDIDD